MTKSRLLIVLLVLLGLAGLAAFIRSRRKGGQVVDVTDAPVVPEQQQAARSGDALPVAGTASSDGGLGAAAMQH
jgi:hypothetical protein